VDAAGRSGGFGAGSPGVGDCIDGWRYSETHLRRLRVFRQLEVRVKLTSRNSFTSGYHALRGNQKTV